MTITLLTIHPQGAGFVNTVAFLQRKVVFFEHAGLPKGDFHNSGWGKLSAPPPF
jgi:hypothetical protein